MRVGLVGRRRRVEGAGPAQPPGELGEALRRHILRVHEEGAARGAPVVVHLQEELGRLLDVILDEGERRRGVPEGILAEAPERAQDRARLSSPIPAHVEDDARAGEERLQELDPRSLVLGRRLQVRGPGGILATCFKRAELDELLEAEDLIRTSAHVRTTPFAPANWRRSTAGAQRVAFEPAQFGR